ncbi:MAG TPA: class I SAM-dependent methyltransferase [Flavisolibacter sp.]|nr:class I SAM-dependent methyltransferase [Flavisolibacter sp.]
MDQPFGKYLMFRNRLEKVYRHLSKAAKRQGVSCFRVYDHDLPEFPFLIELYEDKLYVSEYKRRHGLGDEAHDAWLEDCRRVMEDVLRLEPEHIYIRMRQRKAGRQGQYQRLTEERAEFAVKENGLQFLVNLSDYLDTGLFLDHRLTRQMVRELAGGKRVLNLFCYTGSFSVYAAAGGAARVVSVDLSKTYLGWAERNMQLNFAAPVQHETVHADVKAYLRQLPADSFDLIVLDPPTFSNSKRMDDFLDIQRDHVTLVNDCLETLTPGGLIFFSTNFTRFSLEEEKIRASEIRDITRQTTPFDFEGKLKRPCFRIVK